MVGIYLQRGADQTLRLLVTRFLQRDHTEQMTGIEVAGLLRNDLLVQCRRFRQASGLVQADGLRNQGIFRRAFRPLRRPAFHRSALGLARSHLEPRE